VKSLKIIFLLLFFSFTFTYLPSSLLSSPQQTNPDFSKYRDFGHLSGFIGNYLSKPRKPVTMSSTEGTYKLTFYWITRESESSGRKTEEILIISAETKDENPINVSKSFKRDLDREGTAILEDGRLINVIDRNETKRYLDISTKYPTGLGCKNNNLTPFISVAVSSDNKELYYGDKIYVPDAKGTPLPDGGKHDGLFSVDDTGKGIAKDQIDVFVFIKDNWPGFQNHLKTHKKRFFVYKVFQNQKKQ